MGSSGYYPYEPNSAGAIIAMLCFGGSAIAHLWQMVRTRTWFFTAFLIGAFSKELLMINKPRTYKTAKLTNLPF
jgi:hypothetical protein